jgi:hypothetical protein
MSNNLNNSLIRDNDGGVVGRGGLSQLKGRLAEGKKKSSSIINSLL